MEKLKQFLHTGFLKTIWFNFRYFKLNEAVFLPVLLARDVQIRQCKRGFCELLEGGKFGVLRFGFCDRLTNYNQKSSLAISGKIIVVGSSIHAFGPGTRLVVTESGTLTIGDNFTASVNNRIVCHHSITIGDDNMWSFDNIIMDTDSHQILQEDGNVNNKNKSILFGDHVWLGCRNIVLKGTTIPNGCMVASGSKLSCKYEKENCIITSQKAILKENIKWKRDRAI